MQVPIGNGYTNKYKMNKPFHTDGYVTVTECMHVCIYMFSMKKYLSERLDYEAKKFFQNLSLTFVTISS